VIVYTCPGESSAWAMTMAAAFFAALVLFRKPYREHEQSDTAALKRGLLVFGFVIGVMLLVGALVYFLPLR